MENTIGKGDLLIVDDDEQIREMLKRRLEREGYFITCSESGSDALENIEKANFDAVFLDIMMPDMDGIETLKIIRKTFSQENLPVIMISANQESKDIVEAINYGASDYISKPIDFPVALARLHIQLLLKNKCAELESKNNKINDFVKRIVHDLKNPAGGIMGISNLFLEFSTNLNMEQISYLNMINKAAKSMISNMDEMLEITKFESKSFTLDSLLFNPYGIILGTIEIFLDIADVKNIKINNHIDENLPSVHGDMKALQDCLSNYLSNAIKYSPAGTEIQLYAEEIDNSYLKIMIQDEGLGMNEKDLSKVFQEFQKLSSRPTGKETSSGLGLSIVKNLIERMDGIVGVNSGGKGKGSTFWLTLKIGEP